jgi:hypothetical protein
MQGCWKIKKCRREHAMTLLVGHSIAMEVRATMPLQHPLRYHVSVFRNLNYC